MTSRRALLATSYIWTVKYTTIVVDSPFDSTADLYAATNEAIASDTFADAVESDLGVTVVVDDESISTREAGSKKKKNDDVSINTASLAMAIIGGFIGLILICGLMFYFLRNTKKSVDVDDIVEATTINTILPKKTIDV